MDGLSIIVKLHVGGTTLRTKAYTVVIYDRLNFTRVDYRLLCIKNVLKIVRLIKKSITTKR